MIIFDSSFLIGFYNNRDAHHSSALLLMERFLKGEWGKGLILEYVFLEVVTVLLARRNIATASKVGRLLLEARELEFVPCSSGFLETWMHFSIQKATRFSLTDVAILVESTKRGVIPVLTFDHEFAKVKGLQVNPVQTPQQ